ncbi:MAG TPA: ABC transporter permease [Actinoplanes sp.]|jgi:ABC-type transport system involved in multi-copper enzyme maturation permease subunit
MNLVKAELFKIRTTSLWWILAIVLLPLYAASVALNWAVAASQTGTDASGEAGGELTRTAADPARTAAELYTSGQYMGVLIVLLLSAIIVTSEFFHLTATSTFLVTPRREAVILAKFAAAVIVSLLVWAATTLLNLAIVPLILSSQNVGAQLGESTVWQAVGLNALAFVLWAVLGVGAGVLIRSQIAATLVLAILYTVGSTVIQVLFDLLSNVVAEWIGSLQVLIPTVASQLMISGVDLPGDPPRYVGALVLIGYALVGGVLGTVLTKHRDIS